MHKIRLIKRVLISLAAIGLPIAAVAQSLGVDGQFGNRVGCDFGMGRFNPEETIILIRPDEFYFFASEPCYSFSLTPSGDGEYDLSANCQMNPDLNLGIAPDPNGQGLIVYSGSGYTVNSPAHIGLCR